MVELTLDDNGQGIRPSCTLRCWRPPGPRPLPRPAATRPAAICRDIVEAYGGWIRVEPAEGGGSRSAALHRGHGSRAGARKVIGARAA